MAAAAVVTMEEHSARSLLLSVLIEDDGVTIDYILGLLEAVSDDETAIDSAVVSTRSMIN